MADRTDSLQKSDTEIDFSDAPEWSEDMMARAILVRPEDRVKRQLTLRIDPDIIEHFKRDGRGYQTRINAVLRAFVDAREAKEKGQPRKAS